MTDAPAYGLWLFALLNAAIFIMFAFSFFKPQTSRNWRSFGPFQILSFILIGLGFWMISTAWMVLNDAQHGGTLAMYLVLIWMYVRLARSEERETRATFGATSGC